MVTGTVTLLQNYYSVLEIDVGATLTNYYAFYDDADFGGGAATNAHGFWQVATNHPNQFNSITTFNNLAILAKYTVATLPASPPDGAMAMATDCTLTMITGLGLAPTGGGTNHVPVVSSAGIWKML